MAVIVTLMPNCISSWAVCPALPGPELGVAAMLLSKVLTHSVHAGLVFGKTKALETQLFQVLLPPLHTRMETREAGECPLYPSILSPTASYH